MCQVVIFANEYIRNIKYLNCEEADQDKIDHHSWPESLIFSSSICTTAYVECITAMVHHVFVRTSTSKGGKTSKPRPQNRISVPLRGSFQIVRRAPVFYTGVPQGC